MRTALRNGITFTALAAALGIVVPAGAQQPAPAAGPRTLKMQSTWPASSTLQENFKFFAERVDKLTSGQLKVDAMAAGQIVPPFEVLDATHRKVLDGAHAVSYYWIGKHKATTLFASTPAGPFGMDHMDFLGWMYEGGGLDLYWEMYQKEMKLNVIAFPILPSGPQAFGWFKRPIKNLADFKGMKCRQTGIVAEIFQKMGMQTVNMPGGEIVPSAQRGVIDCAEWVGGIEDLRLGLPQVFKYHYVPGMHEPSVVGELLINNDVWISLPAQQQEAIRSATVETLVRWWVRWQKQNADAIVEMRTKYGTVILRTPPDILIAFLKAWDEMAKEESAKNPFFKKVLDSQRAWASVVVPAKRFMNPPYSFAANYYWPEKTSTAAKGGKK
jgi:TRAP-type mannitol/chloroaromatic compound transport system substrate-binding protein